MFTQQVENTQENNVITVTAATRARAIERKLSASVQKLSLRTSLEQLISNAEVTAAEQTDLVEDSAPHCQDGVCMRFNRPSHLLPDNIVIKIGENCLGSFRNLEKTGWLER